MPGALQPYSLVGGDVLITQTTAEHEVPSDRQTKDSFICFYLFKHFITCLIVYEGIYKNIPTTVFNLAVRTHVCLCSLQHTQVGDHAFVIHCCRWVLIRMCAGVQLNKIWKEIMTQRTEL